ncbi:hypothetical protein MAC_09192 [Metarhizium acridum CQMa 102]|uniref:Uncharacterized protein n=1 Tax=Metarhizium acridum (strain CQMa 102) TaxID=655827 RepID=E9EH44_METAQ|nr:uncharacterized protein MAC_09192 [Metarhizium acridum CQMa 102]EFY84748.1 hypothetical protein MAC_09192 [Metarhizium acridum CQMa 102]
MANNGLPGNAFTNNNGLAAAKAAAPMWCMPSGTCMPPAAEDGQGHQTNGVDADNCNIGKKDTGHKSDWEGIVVSFSDNGDNNWVRDTVKMEQDGNHKQINWGGINDTFDGLGDWQISSRKTATMESSTLESFTTLFTKTDACPPNSENDFRNGDYQFWAKNNLRHVSVLNPSWNWGKASSPVDIDLCTY